MKTLITFAMLASTPSIAAECYTSLTFASHHVNATREFNEFNPGLGLGCSWGSDRFRYGVEGGYALNSYSDWGSYGAGFANVRLAEFENVGLWAGGFMGLGEYPNLVSYADKLGIPRIGDHIMVAGLTGIAEFERFSLVVNYIPWGSKMAGVAIFKVQIPFGK